MRGDEFGKIDFRQGSEWFKKYERGEQGGIVDPDGLRGQRRMAGAVTRRGAMVFISI